MLVKTFGNKPGTGQQLGLQASRLQSIVGGL